MNPFNFTIVSYTPTYHTIYKIKRSFYFLAFIFLWKEFIKSKSISRNCASKILGKIEYRRDFGKLRRIHIDGNQDKFYVLNSNDWACYKRVKIKWAKEWTSRSVLLKLIQWMHNSVLSLLFLCYYYMYFDQIQWVILSLYSIQIINHLPSKQYLYILA